jgi:hypothetical protein
MTLGDPDTALLFVAGTVVAVALIVLAYAWFVIMDRDDRRRFLRKRH